jgi:dihydroneopterin aldolase
MTSVSPETAYPAAVLTGTSHSTFGTRHSTLAIIHAPFTNSGGPPRLTCDLRAPRNPHASNLSCCRMPSPSADAALADVSPASHASAAVPRAAERPHVGTVRLVNAVFYAHHGVMQEEHRIGGRYEVDVAAELDFEAAARDDDLTGTVDYEQVYAAVREIVTQNNFYLIEKLAYLIAERVAAAYPHIEAVEVTVRKPNPPVGGPCDRAEATFRRRVRGA